MLQIDVRVESGRTGLFKLLEKSQPVAPLDEVPAGACGLLMIQDYQVFSALILGSLRACSASFLVCVFPVNDRGKSLPRVAFNPLPDGDDRPAGRINYQAPLVLQLFVFMDGSANRRDQ